MVTRSARVGPIIDAHTHPMLSGESPIMKGSHTAADYEAAARGLDVRYVAALVMAPRSDLARTRTLNDRCLELSRESHGRFFAMGSVHPGDGADALTEIDRIAEAGVRGLKLHPNTQGFDVADPTVTEVVRRASAHHLPVLFDAYSPFDADQPGKFVRLAMEVPEARLILAHAHGPRFADLLVYDVLARYPWWGRNVWVDLSATAALLAESPFRDQFLWVCRRVGVDRLLFGSDYPMDRPKDALRAIRSLGFSSRELEAILYGNAAQLFGLPPATPSRRSARAGRRSRGAHI